MESCIVYYECIDDRALPPVQAYPGDAGWDLHILEDTFIAWGQGLDVRTGIAVAMPEGHYGRIVGRSSAMRRKGVLVVEGIIDAGFRGELFSYAYVPGVPGWQGGVDLKAGDSIAQLIVSPIPRVYWHHREQLPDSERGVAGFGSSGR